MPLTGTHSVGDSGHTDDHNTIDNDITTLQSQMTGKAATAHTHAEADVTSLTTDLAAKLAAASNLSDVANAATARTNLGAAATSHTHAEADVTSLTTDLAAKLVKASNLSDVANAATARSNLGAAATSHSHAESDVTSLTTDLAAKAPIQEATNTVGTSGSTQTLPDVTTDTVNYVTLTANCTFTFPTAAAGKSFTLVLKQDATGSRTATWPGTVKWPGGTAPTLTTTAAKIDVLSFVCVDGTNWLGFTAGQNF